MSIELIAELSMNHLGDKVLIDEMVCAAAHSGADYAKFQTWKVDNLRSGPWDNDGRKEDYKKAEMTKERLHFAVDCCNKYEIKFLTSCFYVGDLDLIRSFSSYVKIPGPESSNEKLVESAIQNFDTVYLSTGASDEEEFMKYAKYSNVYLLHAVSCYPCLGENVNMKRMLLFKMDTDNIGYSGHMLGINDAILAISLGAKVVEKHFTIDRNLPFRDNKFSILPEEFKKISEYAKDFEKMMIYKGIDHQKCEDNVRQDYARRWCFNEKV